MLVLFLFFKGANSESYLKKKKKKKKIQKNYVYKFWYWSSFLILYHLINVFIKT